MIFFSNFILQQVQNMDAVVRSRQTYLKTAAFSAQIILRTASRTVHGRRSGLSGMLFPPCSANQILHQGKKKKNLHLLLSTFLTENCFHHVIVLEACMHNYLISPSPSPSTILPQLTWQYFHRKGPRGLTFTWWRC